MTRPQSRKGGSMTNREFEIFIDDITSYYQKSKPRKETAVLWFSEIMNIPSESLEWIKKKIYATKYPENMPKTLWALYYQWLEENPNKKANTGKGCNECEDGWIFYLINRNSYAIRCEYCNRAENQPASNRAKIQARGHELSWVHLPTNKIREMKGYVYGKRMEIGVFDKALKEIQPEPEFYDDEIPF